MPIPPWLFRNYNAHVEVIVDSTKYDKTSIYLTDARRVGIMLRDSRLTLRNHSALTRFIVEAVSTTDFILQAPAVGGDNSYVTIGNKGAFFAQASREKAQKFQFKVTDLGVELYLADQRPAVFDDFYDVSIGKFETGRSSIPILIHTDVSAIWPAPDNSSSQPQVAGVP
jgi:hypothetical protein